MSTGTREEHLEEHITRYLSRNINPDFSEYVTKNTSCYSKDLCLIQEDLIDFIKDTQFKKYQKIEDQYGADTDRKIAYYASELIRKGKNKTLAYFRMKLKICGQHLDTVYFKPQHDKSPEHWDWYKKNRLTVVRQLKYSHQNENSVDVVLFVNGMPVVTIELKNALTGQYLSDAIKQYIKDRNPKEPLFEFKRCLVHFAVSTEKVAMCTELKGKSTYFLPFNKGLVNTDDNNYATAYLWEDVLSKDSLLNLIQNYINVQVNKDKYYDPKSGKIKESEKEVLIFPRYHQRRAVERILGALEMEGVGGKYLIQHSAGSGKSNTIAWLAHRLSGFYQNINDSRALFNSTIVVTDRRVLNRQIQDSIRQFEQVPGAVVYIDDSQPSSVLAKAIENCTPIIVTTLFRFPVISESIAQNRDKTYAVIIDEAHSSQTGEAARHLRKALSLDEAEKLDGTDKSLDDVIMEEIRAKGDQKNVSFFAFTATPKDKTIEMFGTIVGTKKDAFDTYTMEQAIKEGFIKDVLKNYMSWKRYYKLIKRRDIEDKEYDKKKTVRLLASFVDLQDHAIEKKARIMIEHFVAHTQNEIQGKARAMLVTRSRLHAVRFKRKFDEIMREMRLPYGALVAFSGTVTDSETGMDYTKENMNNLGGRIEIPDALKMPQFRILIVANMYQTGFDEPLLHTMFVDKKLGGPNTVQTLSRLNRTCSGKDTTMVLDFVNDPEKVQEDFQKYYGSNYMELDDQTDPNSLYDIQNKIDSFNIIYGNDIERFAELFFKKGDHKEKLQPILNEIVRRYSIELDAEQQFEFKTASKNYIRFYRFIAQIMTFADVLLEKYYVLLTNLYKKLPYTKEALPTEVLEEVDLDSYKLQRQYTTDLTLESSDTAMQGMTPGGNAKPAESEFDLLSHIIKTLNDTFGLELKDEDKVDFERMKKNIYDNQELMSFFNAHNTKDNIQDKFFEEIDNELLNFINTKLDFYNKLSEDKVNHMFKHIWFNDIYDKKVRGLNYAK